MILRSGKVIKMSKSEGKTGEVDEVLSRKHISIMSVLPTFDGDSDSCHHFFELFSELADLANWSDQERVTIVKSRLKGNALRYLVDSPKLKNVSFEDLRKDFESFFVKSQSLTEKHLSFNEIKLLPNEPIKTLAYRINTAISRLMNDMTSFDSQCLVIDRLKLTKFIDALPADYQREVLKLAPDGFDKAVELASKYQVALQSTQQLQCQERVNACLPRHEVGSDSSRLERQIDQLQEQINALKVGREYGTVDGNRGAHNQLVCFYCNGLGHTMSRCYIYKRDHLNVRDQTRPHDVYPSSQNERGFQGNRGPQNYGRYPVQGVYSPQGSRPRFQNPLNSYRSPR